MRWLGLLIVSLSLLACGGSGGGDSPADVSKARFELLGKGQFDKAWDLLHPAHQAIVPKELYVKCGQQLSAPPTPLKKIKVLGVSDEQYDVAEVGAVPAKAVKLRLTFPDGSERETTDHIVSVDGKWRWVLTEQILSVYRGGDCPPEQ